MAPDHWLLRKNLLSISGKKITLSCKNGDQNITINDVTNAVFDTYLRISDGGTSGETRQLMTSESNNSCKYDDDTVKKTLKVTVEKTLNF